MPYNQTYPTVYGFGQPSSQPGMTQYQPASPFQETEEERLKKLRSPGYVDNSRPQPFSQQLYAPQMRQNQIQYPGAPGSPNFGPRDTTLGGQLREQLMQLREPTRGPTFGEMTSDIAGQSPFMKAFGYGQTGPEAGQPGSGVKQDTQGLGQMFGW